MSSEINFQPTEVVTADDSKNSFASFPQNKQRRFKKIFLYGGIFLLFLLVGLVGYSIYKLQTTSLALTVRLKDFQKVSTEYSDQHGGDYTGICESPQMVELIDKVKSVAIDIKCQVEGAQLQIIGKFKDETLKCSSLVNAKTLKQYSLACIALPNINTKQQENAAGVSNKAITLSDKATLDIQPEEVVFPSKATLLKIDLPFESKKGRNNNINYVDLYGDKLGFVVEESPAIAVIGGSMESCLQTEGLINSFSYFKPYKGTFLALANDISTTKLFVGCKRLGAEYEKILSLQVVGDDVAFSAKYKESDREEIVVYKDQEYTKNGKNVANIIDHGSKVVFSSKTLGTDLNNSAEVIYVGNDEYARIPYNEGELKVVFSTGGKLGYAVEQKNAQGVKIFLDKNEVTLPSQPLSYVGSVFAHNQGAIDLGKYLVEIWNGNVKVHGPFAYGVSYTGGITDEHVMFAGQTDTETVIYKNGTEIAKIPGRVQGGIVFSKNGNYAYRLNNKIYLGSTELTVPTELVSDQYGAPLVFVDEKLLVKGNRYAWYDNQSYDFGDDTVLLKAAVFGSNIMFIETHTVSKNSKGIDSEVSVYFQPESPLRDSLIKNINFIKLYRDSN